MVRSDHHLITKTLRFPQKEGSTNMRRQDASILADLGDVESIRPTNQEYFQLNDTPDVAPMNQWEAQKCVVQGHLLAIAARKKKEHQVLILTLSEKITKLEAQHKRSPGYSDCKRISRHAIIASRGTFK